MTTDEHAKYWLDSAAHDLDAAEAMFQNGKYTWCLFIGHLVLEKTLKAFFMRDTQKTPPTTHNLARIAEGTKLVLADEQKQLLMEVNDFNIEARYPDYKLSFYKLCTPEFTSRYFTAIKEMHAWLLAQMKP